jgi:hypothetical protein
MVESMAGLLSWRPEAALLPPAHLLALLDPAAAWLSEWLHSLLARSHLIASLARSPRYLSSLMDNLIRDLESKPLDYWNMLAEELRRVRQVPADASRHMSCELVQAVVFMHNLSLVGKMARFRQAWGLLPDQARLLAALVNILSVDHLDPDLGRLLARCLRSMLAESPDGSDQQLISMMGRLSESAGSIVIVSFMQAMAVPQLPRLVCDNFLSFCHQVLSPTQVTPDIFAAMTQVILMLHVHCPIRNSEKGEALLETFVGLALEDSSSGRDLLLHMLRSSTALVSTMLSHEPEDGPLHLFVASNIQLSPDLLSHFPSGAGDLLDRQLDRLWELLSGDRTFVPLEDAASDRQLLETFCLAVAPNGIAGRLEADSPLETDPGLQERLLLPAYNTAILRLLMVAAANLDTRMALISDFGLKGRIDRELEACYLGDEPVVDESYLHLRYLRGWLSGLAGPQEAPLPDLQPPGERASQHSR